MYTEPKDRYALAQEWVDDLRRSLEHRTILASRPTMPEPAVKWAGRHTTLVA